MTLLLPTLVWALLGAQDESAKQVADFIEKLRSDRAEEREAAAVELKKRGDAAVPALEKAAGDPSADVAARARLILRTIAIRKKLSPAFLKAFPNGDDRLVVGEPAVWTDLFLQAARKPEIEPGDLAALCANALRGAGTTRAHDKICDALEKRKVRAAVPDMIAWIRSAGRCTFPMSRALGAIGDPAAVPVLLDYPNLNDEDLLGTTGPALQAIGAAAYPEYERRIQGWKEELAKGRPTAVQLSLGLLGGTPSEETRKARLDIVAHFTSEKRDFVNERRSAELYVFSAALSGIAVEHPDRAIEALWSAVEFSGTFVSLVSGITSKPIIVELWNRVRNRPASDDRVREVVLRVLGRYSPETLAIEAVPVSGSDEARAILFSIRHDTDLEQAARAIRRVETYLAGNPDPEVQFFLADRHVRQGDFEKALPFLDAALPKLGGSPQKANALHRRAEVRLRLGNPEGAEKDLRLGLERTTPQPGAISNEVLERMLKIVALHPRDPNVKVLTQVRLSSGLAKAPFWMSNSYMESAGGRAFYLSDPTHLCSADVPSRTFATFPKMPSRVRDYMPIDARRVFVALDDGTAALYDSDKSDPVWTRTFWLGFNSYLTASNRAITAAEIDGTLHAIDPATGKTTWSSKVIGQGWPQGWWRSERGNIVQGGDKLLLPDRNRDLHVAELATGKVLSTLRLDFTPAKLCGSEQMIFLTGTGGEVVAFSCKDGSIQWRERVQASASYPLNEVSAVCDSGGKFLYVAFQARLWCLDGSTGKTVWTWTWKPQTELLGRQEPWPTLCLAEEGLYCVVNWETMERQSRGDVAFLTLDGKPIFQHASPQPDLSSSDYTKWPFAVGRNLVLYKYGWELWERAPAK